MRLILSNNLTKKEVILDVIDKKTSGKYFNFSLSLPSGMDDGEYDYTLIDQGDIVATGLLQIGDYVPKGAKTEYNEKEEYIVYNGD